MSNQGLNANLRDLGIDILGCIPGFLLKGDASRSAVRDITIRLMLQDHLNFYFPGFIGEQDNVSFAGAKLASACILGIFGQRLADTSPHALRTKGALNGFKGQLTI